MKIMQDALSREQMLDMLEMLTGSRGELDNITSEYLMAILTNTIARTTDAAKLDRALDGPLSFEITELAS